MEMEKAAEDLGRKLISVQVEQSDINEFFERACGSPWFLALTKRHLNLPEAPWEYKETRSGVEFLFSGETPENPGYDRWVGYPGYQTESLKLYDKFNKYRWHYWDIANRWGSLNIKDAVNLSEAYGVIKDTPPFEFKALVGSGLKIK